MTKPLAQIMYEAYWVKTGTAGYPWERLPHAARECWEDCERATLNHIKENPNVLDAENRPPQDTN